MLADSNTIKSPSSMKEVNHLNNEDFLSLKHEQAEENNAKLMNATRELYKAMLSEDKEKIRHYAELMGYYGLEVWK
ncbi:hypothetical protein [Vibrio salinus]|uniref:hypothetical protein n=1 Tax=Vibrio salinus TaxID=2899784 RepID=UPI001E37C21A|nr:hypothetical protein [Vibrio salinus]MCE0494715.1 hypothetical protein [Vibrio salinus]